MRSGILQGSSGAGSLQRHLTNITSMLEPHITLSMSKAVTKMAGVQREFLRLGHDVARAYSHLKAREKTLVMDFIKEANVKGIWYNKVNQLAAGLSKTATDTLALWKKYWANNYRSEESRVGKEWVSTGKS